MVFGGTTGSLTVDVGYLAQYIKPTIIDIGFKMDLKFDSQIRADVKSSFFQLRQLAKLQPILSRHQFETVHICKHLLPVS